MICSWCGSIYPGSRSSRYCKAACKQAAYRHRQALPHTVTTPHQGERQKA